MSFNLSAYYTPGGHFSANICQQRRGTRDQILSTNALSRSYYKLSKIALYRLASIALFGVEKNWGGGKSHPSVLYPGGMALLAYSDNDNPVLAAWLLSRKKSTQRSFLFSTFSGLSTSPRRCQTNRPARRREMFRFATKL